MFTFSVNLVTFNYVSHIEAFSHLMVSPRNAAYMIRSIIIGGPTERSLANVITFSEKTMVNVRGTLPTTTTTTYVHIPVDM